MPNGPTNGSHPPGNKFDVKCVGKTGLVVSFLGDGAGLDATFAKQEDADYFKVESSYVVDFSLARTSDSGGDH